MKYVLVNYNYRPEWLLRIDTSLIDYLIYDRSDSDVYLSGFPKERIIKTENKGQYDYDKLGFLVGNYYELPDVFLWGQTNFFKSISEEEFEKVKDNTTYTPLLTQNHVTYSDERGVVCYYHRGMYYERNDSWYVNCTDYKYFHNFNDFCKAFFIKPPAYIPFAPGGNYILTREVVHKYAVDYYENMMNILPHCANPAEAHMCERAYHLIWGV